MISNHVKASSILAGRLMDSKIIEITAVLENQKKWINAQANIPNPRRMDMTTDYPVVPGLMVRVCCECGKVMGYKPGEGMTHGLCAECTRATCERYGLAVPEEMRA